MEQPTSRPRWFLTRHGREPDADPAIRDAHRARFWGIVIRSFGAGGTAADAVTERQPVSSAIGGVALVDNGAVDPCLICAEARGVATPLAFSDEVAAVFPARLRSMCNPGAALIVTTAHHPTLDDLPAELVGPFFERVRRVALAVQHVSGADGTTLFQNNHPPGQELPHLHVHVIPRFMGDEWPLTATIEVGIEERARWAERLRDALEAQ